ncbi:MAG: hypothetical protein EA352_02645 [Gemmatimonadales bacterium]|nr:MAG: hypothetical protein EA352_02645 [Gemmatimonadales bacterium]
MPVRSLLLKASESAWLAGQARRRSFVQASVRRFLPGEALEDAVAASETLRARGVPVCWTRLGEYVHTPAEVDEVVAAYRAAVLASTEAGLDMQLSVKPTQLGLGFDAGLCREATVRLVELAGAHGVPVWLDMEAHPTVDATLALAEAARAALPHGAPGTGVCLQAYLHRTPEDLARMLEAGVRVRLVKGAYREPPSVALQDRSSVDDAFRLLAMRLMEAPDVPDAGDDSSGDGHGDANSGMGSGGRRAGLLHVLGTHDTELLASLPVPVGSMRAGDPSLRAAPPALPVEVQMLYGIRTGVWDQMISSPIPFRVLVSWGEHWYPWFVRRLAERPSNLRFLVRGLLPGGG